MLRELQQCEEYKQFVSHETNSYNKTIDPTEEIQKENERLRKQLEQREQKRQAEVEAIKKAAEKREREFQAQVEQKRQAEIAALEQAAAQRERELKAQIEKHERELEAIKQAAEKREQELKSQIENLKKHYNTNPNNPVISSSKQKPKSEEVVSHIFRNINVNDIINFGNYPQGKQGQLLSLEWRVLAVENNRALIITDKLIDYKKYNEKYNDVTWENCSLRIWMNNEFLSSAFSTDQQKRIAVVTIQNPNNPKYDTKGGVATQDKVFALSIPETIKYFSSYNDRKAILTDYLQKAGLHKGNNSDFYWLRSPGSLSARAAQVDNDGITDRIGRYVTEKIAVRPAMWIIL